MTGWFLRDHDRPPTPENPLWRLVPPPAIAGWADPAHYNADQPLLDAATAAIWLGQPLLLTGEPGCGKTEFANHLAWRLGLSREIGHDPDGSPLVEHALRFDMKSDTRARDLFYTLDIVERFHAAHFGQARDEVAALNFIRFQALGRAVLYALAPGGDLEARLHETQPHPGAPRRSVVLIDEIDKAPRDVPNDLLMEIEQMRFHMPELNRTVAAPRALRPILVITSNSERALPDAFLRRCVFHHMTFPGPEQLRAIIAQRLDGLKADDDLVKDAVEIFEGARQLPLRKKPATAELLGFVQALREAGFGADARVRSHGGWADIARVTLLKTIEDQGRSLDHLARAPGRA